jgi:hypothetical protein
MSPYHINQLGHAAEMLQIRFYHIVHNGASIHVRSDGGKYVGGGNDK